MLTRLAKRTAHFFVVKKVVEPEDEEIYAYGTEMLYSAVVNIAAAILIALITKTVAQSAAFLAAFFILRQYAGGYHAKTHAGCLTIFTVVMLGFTAAVYFMPSNFYLSLSVLCSAVATLLVIWLAPVEHPNKPLDPKERPALRAKSVVFVIAAAVLSMILSVYDAKDYSMYISLGCFTAAAAMTVEKIKHIYVVREESVKMKEEYSEIVKRVIYSAVTVLVVGIIAYANRTGCILTFCQPTEPEGIKNFLRRKKYEKDRNN